MYSNNIKPVATWCFAPYLNKKSNLWSKPEYMLTAAVRSIELVAEHYGTPTIYTDSLGKEILSALTDKAIFLNVYDDIHKDLIDDVWIYSKILTYQAQTSPYFHFDLDLLCLRKFEDNIFDNDIVVHSSEDVTEPDTVQCYNVAKVRDRYILPEIFDNPDIESIRSFNMGFFYIKDMTLNAEYCNLVLDIIEKNRLEFNNHMPILLPCAIEQQTLGLLLHNKQLKIETLVEEDKLDRWEKDFIHFFGWLKNSSNEYANKCHTTYLAPYVTRPILELADKLRNI